jgi:hypothetical protein
MSTAGGAPWRAGCREALCPLGLDRVGGGATRPRWCWPSCWPSATRRQLLRTHFVWLFWVNVAAAGLLALVIVVVALRLAVRLQRGKFGSRLLIKLAGIFALVGLLPGLVIYTVSYQFVSRSIEAWFDVKVAGALDSRPGAGQGHAGSAGRRPGGQDPRGRFERLADHGVVVVPLTLERCASRSAPRSQPGHGQRPGAADCRRRGRCRPARAPQRRPCCARPSSWARPAIEGLDDESLAPGPPARTSVRWPACHATRCAGHGRRPLRDGGAAHPAFAGASTRWPCRRPTANTSSARWAATACAACTSAR